MIWTGLSVNAFAGSIGLKRAENLYQIKRGNHGISKELAELITSKYTTVSKSWLLTGSGNMFICKDGDIVGNIPFYKIEVVRLMLSRESFTPSAMLSIPFLTGCDLAAMCMSDAMEPEIPQGSIVFIRRGSLEALHPGNTYLILNPAFSGIRVVRREPGSPHLRLVPRNKDEYDEVMVEADATQAIYEIKAVLQTK